MVLLGKKTSLCNIRIFVNGGAARTAYQAFTAELRFSVRICQKM